MGSIFSTNSRKSANEYLPESPHFPRLRLKTFRRSGYVKMRLPGTDRASRMSASARLMIEGWRMNLWSGQGGLLGIYTEQPSLTLTVKSVRSFRYIYRKLRSHEMFGINGLRAGERR